MIKDIIISHPCGNVLQDLNAWESRNLQLLHELYTQKQQHSLNHSCSENTLESQGELKDGLPQGKNLEEMNQV
jgi:hypothetical protein